MNDPTEIPWHAHLTVATIVERDGRYLLVEEIAEVGKPVFNQPSGHVERNETLEQAAIRETYEETGWDVEITGIVGMYLLHAESNDTTYFRVCFAAKPQNHHPEQSLDEGIIAAHWLTKAELQASATPPRSALVMRCIEDYETKPLLPLSRLHHEGI